MRVLLLLLLPSLLLSLQLNHKVVRPLGGYERLLSRLTPYTNTLSLSHSANYIINNYNYNHNDVINAFDSVIKRHPMLRALIVDYNGKKCWAESQDTTTDLAERAITTTKVTSEEEFANAWQECFYKNLNSAEFSQQGPLWRLNNIVLEGSSKSAWCFCVNHGIDDQKSVNIIVNEALQQLHNNNNKTVDSYPFPPSIETAIAPGLPGFRTILWTIYQIINSLSFPKLLPNKVESNYKNDPVRYSDYTNPDKRRTKCRFFQLTESETARLKEATRAASDCAEGTKLTVTNTLSAGILAVTNALIQDVQHKKSRYDDVNLRFLLSVGLRPFGAGQYTSPDFTGGTVACVAGAVDFIVPITKQLSKLSETSGLSQTNSNNNNQIISKDFRNLFWEIAKVCKVKSDQLIKDWELVPESVRLFGLGMDSPIDILKAVEIDAKSTKTMGRGFSCGVSNMGLVNFDSISSSSAKITEAYYATSHGRNGVLCLMSTMTIDGKLCGCLQLPYPIISDSDADYISSKLQYLLTNI